MGDDGTLEIEIHGFQLNVVCSTNECQIRSR